MPWLNHPKFRRIRNLITERLRSKAFHFKKVGSVVFLCGAANSIRRDRLAEYLRKNYANLLLFYAEDVWSVIATLEGRNALQMEAELANLADIVIVVVESPGTFAELGAFSLSNELRPKLLPIIDIEHKATSSFINTGPIRWIDNDSDFSPAIWTHLDKILMAAPALDDRIKRLPPEKKSRISNLSDSPKHLLFFVCDIISIFGPCDILTVDTLVVDILGTKPKSDIAGLVGLGKAMSIIQEIEIGGEKYYFSSLTKEGHLRSFHRNKYIDIPGMRTDVVSVLESIDEARSILRKIGAP